MSVEFSGSGRSGPREGRLCAMLSYTLLFAACSNTPTAPDTADIIIYRTETSGVCGIGTRGLSWAGVVLRADAGLYVYCNWKVAVPDAPIRTVFALDYGVLTFTMDGLPVTPYAGARACCFNEEFYQTIFGRLKRGTHVFQATFIPTRSATTAPVTGSQSAPVAIVIFSETTNSAKLY
jgi:hypothetical protein